MEKGCGTMQELMSGYLDDELDNADAERLETHLKSCEQCRAALNEMTSVVSTASGLTIDEPPDEVWDEFLDGVYNRIERRTGWYLFILGAVFAAVLGVYFLFHTHLLSIGAKFTVEIILVGLALLFSSVMRQRRHHRKTDRYSRDIHR
jgi:predicted anti-sigma-YlaC factor YlaD